MSPTPIYGVSLSLRVRMDTFRYTLSGIHNFQVYITFRYGHLDKEHHITSRHVTSIHSTLRRSSRRASPSTMLPSCDGAHTTS
jgi:hypothetical protein